MKQNLPIFYPHDQRRGIAAHLRDGRQRCRRINVYANVLEEQPAGRFCARSRSLAPSDRFEREWIAEERQREGGRGGSSYRRHAAPLCIFCSVDARSLSSHVLGIFSLLFPLAPSASCMFYGPNIDQDLRVAIVLALPPLLFFAARSSSQSADPNSCCSDSRSAACFSR